MVTSLSYDAKKPVRTLNSKKMNAQIIELNLARVVFTSAKGPPMLAFERSYEKRLY